MANIHFGDQKISGQETGMSNPSGFLTLVSKKKNHRTIIIDQESVFFNKNQLKLKAL